MILSVVNRRVGLLPKFQKFLPHECIDNRVQVRYYLRADLQFASFIKTVNPNRIMLAFQLREP